MPIYEYYCPVCHGRFSHLAKHIGEAAPPCPRCGNEEVERLISAAAVLHDDADHEVQLKEARSEIDTDDAQAVARFLKDSGRLEDTEGLYGSKAYRELIERRIEGATDDDLMDLVDDLSTEAKRTVKQNDALDALRDITFSKEGEGEHHHHHHNAEDDPEHHHHHRHKNRRSSDDLGWAKKPH